MTDPTQSEVWHKKSEVADRTLNERKYCKPCDYYYSEMFTCPICYGERKAEERIIKLLKEYWTDSNHTWIPIHKVIALIKGEK